MKTNIEMMAHDYAKILLANPQYSPASIRDISWMLADEMQAEADKRKVGGVPEAIANEWKPDWSKLSENPMIIPLGSLWQPDWSQAPDGATSWTMRPDGEFLWWRGTPVSDGTRFTDIVGSCHTVGYAPSFNYQGDWKDSLRKRP